MSAGWCSRWRHDAHADAMGGPGDAVTLRVSVVASLRVGVCATRKTPPGRLPGGGWCSWCRRGVDSVDMTSLMAALGGGLVGDLLACGAGDDERGDGEVIDGAGLAADPVRADLRLGQHPAHGGRDPAMRPRGLTLQGYRGGGGHDRQPRAGPVRFGPASAGLIEQTRYPAAGEPAPPGPYDGHAAAQPGGDRRVGRTPASPSPAPARGHPGPGHTKGTAGRTPIAQRPARPYGHCAGHIDSGYRRWPGWVPSKPFR